VTTQYVYDGLDIVQEIENGQVTVNYIRTLNIDEPLTRIEADGTVRHYVTDALGSVIALTDDSGVVKTTYTYDPFGNVTVSGEESDNPFQYTGRENDGTGLYYYRARYYSPELQRFISEDPIGLVGGIKKLGKPLTETNLYIYAQNNPLRFNDPFGLSSCEDNCNEFRWKCYLLAGDRRSCLQYCMLCRLRMGNGWHRRRFL
jgi:RHS repeat-associated protein